MRCAVHIAVICCLCDASFPWISAAPLGRYRSLAHDRHRARASGSLAQAIHLLASARYAATRRTSQHRDGLDALRLRAKLFEPRGRLICRIIEGKIPEKRRE
jgi:hypothetical protein